MWSFFKPKKPDLQAEARKAVEELRSELSNAALAKSLTLNDRVNRLRSVRLEYFNELMGVTDDIADRVFPLYERYPNASALEIHGYCASTVAVSAYFSDLPEDEKPTIIDIYLDLWVDNTVSHAPGLNGQTLQGSIQRMWQGFMPGIMRAAAEEEAIRRGFDDPSGTLVKELDRLAGVERSTAERVAAAKTMKAAVVHAMIAVRALQ
ncbi:hypothetical protein [Rhizobium acaciae]|uniref:hypothetical protein n=1 Tax=Rhizobium acaciae TaxID=2989736 RepID=UPI002220134E|nr:hypothetical protein [Rhizobium acaciae]MCW1753032.1 hypothetical protein [Rhizobium acaciae]